MDPWLWLALSGGFFLGWSLGSNDAANIFGTAVGTRMLRFSTAWLVGGVFVVLGAALSGAGTSATLGALGAVTSFAAAFVVALAAAYAVYSMNRQGLPVSTSQSIVGAIVGWNLFAHRGVDLGVLAQFFSAWAATPVLAGVLAVLLYLPFRALIRRLKVHLLTLDLLFRYALIAAGAFGAYALGANNIANVVGVFVPLADKLFRPQHLLGLTLDPALQLRLFGGVAIALGIWNSYKVMMTVGRDLARLNALAAWVVVVAQALVLLLFASQRLNAFLTSHGLPPLPLVPVSSSQATVGAVVGLGLLLPGRQVDWGLLGRVVAAWVLAPLWAATLSLVGLYVLANVFGVPLLP